MILQVLYSRKTQVEQGKKGQQKGQQGKTWVEHGQQGKTRAVFKEN